MALQRTFYCSKKENFWKVETWRKPIYEFYKYGKRKSSVLWKLKEKEKLVPNQILLTVRNLGLLNFIYEFYQGPRPMMGFPGELPR